MKEWNEISKKIDEQISVGIQVPKTNSEFRKVTRRVENRIYMRTGVKTEAEKYTTKEMIQYAYTIMSQGGEFTSEKLIARFPNEYSNGSCVFSMTGGILVLLGVARCIKNPSGRGVAYVSIDEK